MNRYLLRILQHPNHPVEDLKQLNKRQTKSGKGGTVKKSPPTKEGCEHYQRKCKTVSPCCGKIYSCRFCHDEAEDHLLDRYKVKEIVCNICNTQQPVAQNCNNCKTCLGSYFCGICNLFDNTNRGQFHCSKCGLCRANASGCETFHCDGCNICLCVDDKNAHVCQDTTDSACPICLETLITSTRSFIYTTKCNHLIHEDCLETMFKNGEYRCPLCSVSLVDMTDYITQLDTEVANTTMPAQYNNLKVDIMCNDCHTKGPVKFHVVGHKCLGCGSYNTRRI